MRPREDWMPNNEFASSTRVVPCGKCPHCLRNRTLDWSFRLQQEQKVSTSSCFITLTYELPPQSSNGLQTLKKTHLQKFLKRLRHETTNPLKYYAVGEYGTKGARPHYHIILFNLPNRIIARSAIVESVWQSGIWNDSIPGHIQVDACTGGSITYVAKYCESGSWTPSHDHNTGLMDDREPYFSIMSKKLGLSYITPARYTYHTENLIPYITQPGGILQRMPRYFKEKMFTKWEKSQIKIQAEEYSAINVQSMVNEIEAKKNLIRVFERNKKLKR